MKNAKKINITYKDIIWNYVGSILNIGMNVFLLPVLLNILTPSELGLWYVFSSISGLIVLLDFGFSPTISRNVTLAWCGAKELNKEGLTEIRLENAFPNFILLRSLHNVSKRIYLWISIISMVILLTIGTGYIFSLVSKDIHSNYYLFTWVVYSISIILNMYFSYWSSFLRGIGALRQLSIATIISRSLFILISILGLLLNGGLLSIAFAQIISGLVLRIFCKYEFIKNAGNDFLNVSSNTKSVDNLVIKKIMPNSTKYGIVSIGGFLSQRADILLCSSFLGLSITSSYGLTMQLLNLLGSISQLLFSSYSSQITQEKLKGNRDKVISIFSVTVAFQFMVGILGIITLIIFGPWILEIIGTSSKLLSRDMILFLGIILLFEWNTSLFLNFLLASNKVPFIKNSMFSGIFIFISSIILLISTKLGVFALIAGRVIVGFGFNNWYWPRYVCNEIKTSFRELLIMGSVNLLNKIKYMYQKVLNKGEVIKHG